MRSERFKAWVQRHRNTWVPHVAGCRYNDEDFIAHTKDCICDCYAQHIFKAGYEAAQKDGGKHE